MQTILRLGWVLLILAAMVISLGAKGCLWWRDKDDDDDIIISGSSGPTIPDAPSGLTATAISTSQIDLAWTDNSTDEDNFRIERSLDNLVYNQIDTVESDITLYSNTGLTPSTPFYYRVRAYNSAGYSSYCDPAYATTFSSFGANGFIVHDNAAGGNGLDWGWDITTDANNKILVCGQSNNGSNADMAIWRYNSEGNPDEDFGTNGVVVDNGAAGGDGDDYAESILIDNKGKILVVGHSQNAAGNKDMTIWRYEPETGTPDTNFGNNGVVTHTSAAGGDGDDGGYAITLDTDNKILVTGASMTDTHKDMVIWRYKPNGTLDETFNSVGFVVHNGAAGGNGDDYGEAIKIDTTGKIVVCGWSINQAGNKNMVIWRYNSDGTPDKSFGTDENDWFVVGNNAAGGNEDDWGFDLVIDDSGKILVTGRTSGTLNAMVIWRYNDAGTPDITFGMGGVVTHTGAAGGTGPDGGNAIKLDADGKILVTGVSKNIGGNYDMVIWRYNSDDTLDANFGQGGIVIHPGAAGGTNGNDHGLGLTIDAYGRILITGFSLNSLFDDDMVIWRYLTTGELDKE